jgi:hypothetical protein
MFDPISLRRWICAIGELLFDNNSQLRGRRTIGALVGWSWFGLRNMATRVKRRYTVKRPNPRNIAANAGRNLIALRTPAERLLEMEMG